MGALNSVLDMLYDDTDSTVPQSSESSEPQAETNDSTPTVLRHKRILDLDPRSPSEHIFRTPIVVDKSVSSASLATPEPVPIPSLVLDPRSPTCEFLRTPIIPPCSSSESRRVSPARVGLVVGPGAPSSGLAYASSESGIDSTEVSPDVRGDSHSSFSYNASLSTRSPDSVISPDKPCPSEQDGDSLHHFSFPLSAGETTPLARLCPDGSASGDNHGHLLGGQVFETEDLRSLSSTVAGSTEPVLSRVELGETPKSQCVLKCRGQGLVDKRLGALNSKSGLQPRSPLSLVDNSPRPAIPKQLLAGIRPGVSLNGNVDKENRV